MNLNKPKNIRSRFARRRIKGFSLLETLLVLTIFMLFSISVVTVLSDSSAQTQAKAAADKMRVITIATEAYFRDHYADLYKIAPAANQPPKAILVGRASKTGAIPPGPSNGTVSVNGIQQDGFLDSNFIDLNPFNQRTAVLFRKCNNCHTASLEVLITTYGGRQIPDKYLAQAANILGAIGGYVPSVYVTASDNGYILGSYGGWRWLANEWDTGTIAPETGHLQSTMAFNDGGLVSAYLNRTDTGNPEANTMRTNIIMNGNDLDSGAATGEVGVIGSLRATVDIYGQNGVFANNVSAASATISGDATVGADLAVGQNATVGQNLTVTRDAAIGNDLTVANKATINDLVPTYISADTVVYNDLTGQAGDKTSYNKTKLDGIRLGDILPKMSGQYSYSIDPTRNKVPKPVCNFGNNTDFSKARIMVMRQTESYKTIPNVPLSVTTATGNGDGPFVTTVYQDIANSSVQLASAIMAITDPSDSRYWLISWLGDAAAPTSTRKALVQTYCFFG